ncbi:MAG: glycoside hydrolase family 5 protein [Muricoprocola sp.]
MKKKIKALFGKLIVFMLLVGCLFSGNIDKTVSAATVTTTQPISPWTYQKMLGYGMDVDWSKTKSGREYYSTEACRNFKKSGISHVRIRVMDNISSELFKSLDKQIDDCLDNGLIPIIAYQADAFINAPTEANIKKVVSWWSSVAKRYQDKSYLLSFDILIEATDELNKQPEKLNELYECVVTEIRKTNPYRIIMISPRLRSDAAYLSELKIPTDSNGYLMAEWHFYASGPSKSNERKLWTTGTDKERKLITDKIQLAVQWQKKNNIPTWVGAWMPGNYNDGNDYTVSEQVVFASFMKQQLTEVGIPFAVNSDTKFYDREKNSWIESMQPVFECIYGKKASYATAENNKIYQTTSLKDSSNKDKMYEKTSQKLSEMKKNGNSMSNVYLRPLGSVNSQKTYSKNWSDKQLSSWAKLQKKYGCKYIFTVNFNDTPENQLKFYQRMRKAGMKFSIIELGYQQYLPKYTEYKTCRYDEVTRRTLGMTPAKYVKMCCEYINKFKALKVPFYIQFAPEYSSSRKNYKEWNSYIVSAINKNTFGNIKMYGTIQNGTDADTLKLIESLKKNIKDDFCFLAN